MFQRSMVVSSINAGAPFSHRDASTIRQATVSLAGGDLFLGCSQARHSLREIRGDKEFLAESAKTNLKVASITGQEMQKRIADADEISKFSIARMSAMMGH